MSATAWGVAVAAGAAVLAWPARADVTSAVRAEKPRRRLTWRRSDPDAECLVVLDAMVSVLRSGAAATTALTLAVAPFADGDGHTADGWRALRQAALADGADGDVVAAWHELGERWRSDSFADIAAAWQMSQRHGCPLADAMAGAAANVRARRRFQAVVDSSVAGARATMGVLLLLPLLGLALGYLLGVDMLGRYRGASGLVTFWPGLVLLWCGCVWARRMTASALRPPRAETA